MRTVILVLSILFVLTVSLTSQAGSVTCEGREIKAGGQGRSGQVQFNLEEMSATWNASGTEESTWLAEGLICGLSTENADCFVHDNSMSRTRSQSVSCRKPGSEKFYAVFSIVTSEVTRNGRMTCYTSDPQQTVEFSNCSE